MSYHRSTTTTRRSAALVLTGGLLAATALAACGSAQDAFTERALEQISGEGVDIERDGDDFTIKTEDGEASFSVSSDVPEAWNSLLGVMPGATVGFTSSSTTSEGTVDSVTLDVDGDAESVLDYYGPKLLAAGFTEVSRYSSGSGSDNNVGATYQRGEDTVSITAYTTDGETAALIGLVTAP